MAQSNRKSLRLKNYDYSSDGAYFITICTKNQAHTLGQFVGGGVLDAPSFQLTHAGMVTEKYLNQIGSFYDNIRIDKYVIMPNHLHFLMTIESPEGSSRTPTPTKQAANAHVPQIISTFKRFVGRELGASIFQRGSHDHIVRCERDYLRIWNYIDTNPQNWTKDRYYDG